LFHAGGRTGMTELTVAFRNFAKVLKNYLGLVKNERLRFLPPPFSTLPSGTSLSSRTLLRFLLPLVQEPKSRLHMINQYNSVIQNRTRDYAHRSVALIIYEVRRQLRKPLIVTASCLTLNLLTSTIVAPPSNASKWQM
jgi:hypothetical protein